MCNKLYKRCYITEKHFLLNNKIKIAEDLCFNLATISSATRICAINEPLYHYRRINSESIMNKNEGTFYLRLNARKELINTLKIININDKVFTKCIQYENCNTVGEYLGEIKEIVSSRQKISTKYKEISILIHEQYFQSSLYNFDRSYLVVKAKLFVLLVKSILYIEKFYKNRQ
jgi:hypothetical protein